MDIKLYNSSRQFTLGKDNIDNEIKEINQVLLREEEFGFSLKLSDNKEFVAVVEDVADTCYKGLIGRYRLAVKGSLGECFEAKLMSFVKGDEGLIVADPILNSQSRFSIEKEQIFYITGKVPKDYEKNNGNLELKVYYSHGYEDESLVWSETLQMQISNVIIPRINESKRIYMDLWQHPCNWARTYDVRYYSDEHFEIIDKYLQGMSKLGQRVCDLIISDYPWAGQRCYQVHDNYENLFELNIIKVRRNIKGFYCDFSALNKYIKLCQKHQMADEINIFGILGNWDAFSFGNPLKDLKDPIRVSYYDETTNSFKFVHNKEKLTKYLTLVFNHIKDLGLWDKTLIISDEPDNVELFEESVDMFKKALGSNDIKIKCAIHHQGFFDDYEENITSLSLNTCELINVRERLDEIGSKVRSKGGKFTWYSCCFPTQLNMFLKSPLIENRIKSWFTYYMNMDGFLRWAYGIWPGNPFEDASYKVEKWSAGDMFFVYPGKNMAPVESVRLKNFIYGLQDLIILDMYEQRFGRNSLMKKLESLLGKISDMAFVLQREVKLNYSLEHEDYINLKNELIKELEG